MIKARLMQAALGLLVIIGLIYGLAKVRETNRRQPIIRWLSAGELAAAQAAAAPVTAPEPVPARADETNTSAESRLAQGPTECYLIKGPVTMLPSLPTPPPAPEPEPEPEKIAWPPASADPLEGVFFLLNEQLHSKLGFRKNDLVLGKIFENLTHDQTGQLDTALPYLARVLASLSAQTENSSAARAQLLEASLDKWWFPAAEKSIAAGLNALEKLAAEIHDGKTQLAGDPEALTALLLILSDRLAGEQKTLLAASFDPTVQTPIGTADNLFYKARGTARACQVLLDRSRAAYPEPLKNKAAAAHLSQAAVWLARAALMDPWIVRHGKPDDYGSNHLLIMSFFLQMSEQEIRAAADSL